MSTQIVPELPIKTPEGACYEQLRSDCEAIGLDIEHLPSIRSLLRRNVDKLLIDRLRQKGFISWPKRDRKRANDLRREAHKHELAETSGRIAAQNEANPEKRHVVISGKSFLYKQKEPFVESGASVLGALEYDEAEDMVRCHECGDWFKHLGVHVTMAHGMSAREYKLKHGLRLKAALVGEGIREGLITRKRNSEPTPTLSAVDMRSRINGRNGIRPARRENMEMRNERGRCPAQILADIKRIAERLGHTPTYQELAERGISGRSVLNLFGAKTLSDVRRLAGLLSPVRGSGPWKTGHNAKFADGSYTQELLVELVRDFYVAHQRLPSESDYRRKLLPDKGTFRRHFGSVMNAYVAAGLLSPGVQGATEYLSQRAMKIRDARRANGTDKGYKFMRRKGARILHAPADVGV